MSKFQLPKTCQDQRLKISVNKLGTSWPVSAERVWRELTLSLGQMADGSDRVQKVNSQWSLFFIDLDELLSEYEHYRSMNDIAITENFGKFISSFAKCISLCITD